MSVISVEKPLVVGRGAFSAPSRMKPLPSSQTFLTLGPRPERDVFEMFAQLRSLGKVTAGKDYNHSDQISKFLRANLRPGLVWSYNRGLSDENYSNPSHIIQPGDEFDVDLIRIVPGQFESSTYSYSSHDALAFLKATGHVFTGAQGLTIVLQHLIEKQKLNFLPAGFSISNFDEPENLWDMTGGNNRQVPGIHFKAMVTDHIGLNICPFDEGWRADNAFLRMVPVANRTKPLVKATA